MKECPKCDLCFGDDIAVCPYDSSQTRLSLPGGQIIAARYFLEKRLGRGAMGQVYLARDLKFETRRVAVKTVRQDVLSSDNLLEGEAILRFEREAQAAASIQHPNTVSVTDFGETDEGVFFLVMEYVEGETLHRLLRREGTLSVRRAINLLRQICDGVEAAHERGILHRDLKPANIFLMQKGKGDGFIKVGDFGLAKIVSSTVTDISSDAVPSSRGIIGTPEFMAPEQMQPELGVDVRADVYAIGTIAYLMLGGRTPFFGDLMQLVMQKIMHSPPPLSSIRSDIPPQLERAIMKSLATDPNERPQTIAEFIESLEAAIENIGENSSWGHSRLVILGPPNAEVYIDDERRGSIGSSGRILLSDIPAGRHVLRISNPRDRDDERVIEIRNGATEQVIQAQFRSAPDGSSQPSSQSSASSEGGKSTLPGVVACRRCGSRFAEGVKFCGRCGNREFQLVTSGGQEKSLFPCPRCSAPLSVSARFCGRCGASIKRQVSDVSRPISHVVSPNPPTQAERVCPKCGSVFPARIRYCGRCGSSLT
ncbi:MAG: hypothetical protein C4324_00025 [Blastocatellia bacterium]